jgi:serine palmitoyltransferase
MHLFIYSLSGKTSRCLNLASYNYLGFAENPPALEKKVLESLEKYGVTPSSYRSDYGTTDLHVILEQKIAEFVGKPDAITTAMGFATNSTLIPALCGKETLIISDSKNHASIAVGARSSGAKVIVFPHNNTKALEKILKEAIMTGQPAKWRSKPWKKIVIIIEGIYSMEGELCHLAEIVRLKKKYKAYLYVDEAHSIGSIGPRGRGICDLAGVDPKEVDVLMGTFTKSFGAVGGYIASEKNVIAILRQKSWSQFYAASMSVPCCEQIIGALDVIAGKDGTDIGIKKINQIRENSIYFREKLIDMGLEVVGDAGSPVICAMIYYPAKVALFSRECLRRGLGVVVVGSPATSLLGSRSRFCISAAHTREDLEFALKVIDEVSDLCGMKYEK